MDLNKQEIFIPIFKKIQLEIAKTYEKALNALVDAETLDRQKRLKTLIPKMLNAVSDKTQVYRIISRSGHYILKLIDPMQEKDLYMASTFPIIQDEIIYQKKIRGMFEDAIKNNAKSVEVFTVKNLINKFHQESQETLKDRKHIINFVENRLAVTEGIPDKELLSGNHQIIHIKNKKDGFNLIQSAAKWEIETMQDSQIKIKIIEQAYDKHNIVLHKSQKKTRPSYQFDHEYLYNEATLTRPLGNATTVKRRPKNMIKDAYPSVGSNPASWSTLSGFNDIIEEKKQQLYYGKAKKEEDINIGQITNYISNLEEINQILQPDTKKK